MSMNENIKKFVIDNNLSEDMNGALGEFVRECFVNYMHHASRDLLGMNKKRNKKLRSSKINNELPIDKISTIKYVMNLYKNNPKVVYGTVGITALIGIILGRKFTIKNKKY
jgi:hypothetical protein